MSIMCMHRMIMHRMIMHCKDEADLTTLHGAGGAAVEDVEELRLRLHEDAGVAVAELGEVLLLATGEARP